MASKAVECFSALSDDRRYTIFTAIAANPGIDHVMLMSKLGISTVWHHLRILVDSGLILRDKQDAKEVYYTVNKDKVRTLAAHLLRIIGEEAQ